MKVAKGCATCASGDKEVSQTCTRCMGLGRTKRITGYKEAGKLILKRRGIHKVGSKFFSLDHAFGKKKVKRTDRPKLK